MVKRKSNSGQFKKGIIPHNKGKHPSKDARQNMSIAQKKRFADGHGHPMTGKHHSEEGKQKMSKARKEFLASEKGKEFLKKIAKTGFKKGHIPSNKGKKRPKEARQKQSVSMKKRYAKGLATWNKGKTGVYSEEVKRKMSLAKKKMYASGYVNHNKGKHHSKESRQKMSIAQQKRITASDYVNPNKGKHYSEERIQKMSKARKEFLASEKGKELSKNQTKRMKEKWANPEYRKNQMEKRANPKSPLRRKGKDHFNYGRQRSAEVRQKMSTAQVLKYKLDDGRIIEKIREARSKQKFPLKDSKPEKFLQKLCNKTGIEFQKHKNFNLGFQRHAVDLFIEPNICIEVDGDYWHGNPNNYKYKGKTHPGLKSDQVIVWGSDKAKTAKWVRENDMKITQALIQQGNQVLRFWQSELEADPEKCIQKIIKIIKESKPTEL